jgi:hypothetical protein
MPLTPALSRQGASVLRGILIVIPLLVTFAVLFAAADPIFGRIVDEIVGLRIDLGDVPNRLAFFATVSWIVAGLLWIVAAEPFREARSLGAAASASTTGWPRLGAIEAVTILVALDALFGVFVVLQVAYLFGGQDTVAASGMPYAQYARRGFFELVLVAILAGGLIATIEAAVETRPAAYFGAALGLVGLTLVVLASSFLRLRLYQDAYGWTELRFYVNAAIGWLALGLLSAGALIVRGKTRWLGHALGVAALGVLAAVNAIGPQAFITDRNLERALNPSSVPAFAETTLDAAYLGTFDADAVPALVAALPRLPAADRTLITYRLRVLGQDLERDAADWPAWNLARERARAAFAGAPPR